MDYARKIGKSDEPKKWVKQFTTAVTTRDGLISPESVFPEDRRLANWQRWLDRRTIQYKRIKSTTGRQQNDQILNSCEKVRPLIEMRNLMDYATVPISVIPDKYTRDGTEFWRTPKTLPKRGPCLPDITFTPSKKEVNAIPELTYVDLPELIEKEKDLVGLKSKEPSWRRSRYLKRREKELSKEIAMLVPKQPETKDLVIRNSVPAIKEPFTRIPPITVSDTEGKERDAGFCRDCYSEQAIVLKIQDREIVWQNVSSKQDRAESDPITWNLTFYGKINERTEKEIVFENKGNRVIVYQWRDATSRSNIIPLAKRTSRFFFNKTKGVILPGQIVKLKIWYLGISHVSTEFWKLTTDPILCSSPLVFRFWGCAETANLLPVNFRPVQAVDKYLNRCIRNTVIREIINDIMENVNFTRHPEPAYGSLFLESELFTVQNSLCFYNPTLLIEFHKIYYNATNQTKHRWNMLLNDIREILLKIKQPERRNTMLSRFAELYKECLEPTLYRPMRYNKYEMIYNLLCSFFNLFEIESELARNAYLANEYKETPGMAPQMSYTMSMNASQPSVKSNNWRNRRGKKSSIRSQSSQVRTIQTEQRTRTAPANDSLYKEIFFIRIYELLGETIIRIFASIESFDNLNERDK